MSLMEAPRHDIPGIDAKRRGNCASVTCHVHSSRISRKVLGPLGPMKESTLDFAEGVDNRSRPACQIGRRMPAMR
jgi:2Fe-2S ferredoxin